MDKQLSSLLEEIKELRHERNTYREELAKVRLENVELKTRNDAMQCELQDQRRTARQASFTERDVSQDTNPSNPRDDVRKDPPEPSLNSGPVMPRRAVEIIDVDMDGDDPEVRYY